eukprot:Nitzschia sp. Nitz4//scaffold159_size51929//6639//8448//NITZ4_006872-RA/size51929-augustus-gene-0.74-mRNA-1//1//CDS//3329537553//3309//frame0
MDDSTSSVEVIATVTQDGNIRTRFIPITESSKCNSSLVDDDEVGHSQPEPRKLSLLEDQPVLVPVGSNSDSEDSCDEFKQDGSSSSSAALVLKSNTTTSTDLALSSSAVAHSDDAGLYDCLSDQFASLFCATENPTSYCIDKTKSEVQTTSVATTSCTEVTCTDPLGDWFSSGNGGTDVFSSFNFWLTPSQEEELKNSCKKSPQNRSTSRFSKRRSHHIRNLWNTWHAEKAIPIERSKSMPSHDESQSLAISNSLSDVCYDSDPEQEHQEREQRGKFLCRPKRSQCFRHSAPTPIVTSIVTIWEDKAYSPPPTPRNSISSGNFNFYPRQRDAFDTPRGRGPSQQPLFFDSPAGPTEYDMMQPEGEDILKEFIQEATNTKIPLVWHRRTRADDSLTKMNPPAAVTGTFEVGAHLDSVVVQPKFTWSPCYEPNLDNRRIRLSGAEPHSIELLSIIRVVKPTSLNRRLYPFARLDRTCCITTNDENFPYLVFEAPTTQERDWMVKALKMIVARLASIIIVRDESLLLEFFTPYAALMHMEQNEVLDMEAEQRQDGPTVDTHTGGDVPGMYHPRRNYCQ